MTVFISQLHGDNQGIATILNHQTATIGQELGFQTLDMFAYPVDSDSDGELSTRLDGIISSFTFNDILILQVPTLMNSNRYDQALLNRIDLFRQQSNSKVVIDVMPNLVVNDKLSADQISLLNRADALIVSSPRVKDELRKRGCIVDHYIYQEMSDYLTSFELGNNPTYNHKLSIYTETGELRLTENWKATDLHLNVYGPQPVQGTSVSYSGPLNDVSPFWLNKDGGFGFVWQDGTHDLANLTVHPEISLFITAGLPIVTYSGFSQSQFIRDHHLGIVANSLDDAIEQVRATNEYQYQQMAQNVGQVAHLTRHGIFTKAALEQAVFDVMIPD